MTQRLLDASFPLATGNPGNSIERQRLFVQGVVQGVGFRPFVFRLATRLSLRGFVGNDSAGVFIELEGTPASLAAFQRELITNAPPLARIEHVKTVTLAPVGEHAFTIMLSRTGAANTLISPDLSICDDCLCELFDPADRRYRYPFINCTNCGPRFTITRQLPYDRPSTTMAGFPLCPECWHEYEDPRNRRFHAQPNACPVCGPQLEFRWSHSQATPDLAPFFLPNVVSDQPTDAISHAQTVLAHGGIVAVKGIGGFHLACNATNDNAVQILRQRKGRVDKPFAVMARDVETVRQFAHISDAELSLLGSPERPIVLLLKKTGGSLSEAIAPGNRCIGVMLPYTPLHHLLFAASSLHPTPCPVLVMTSGNYSDEPIVKDNDEALVRLAGVADAFLLHNRPIHIHCDDSVMRVFDASLSGLLPLGAAPIRRSRGYAPLPIKLPFALPPVLAVGGELKSTFCLTKAAYAFLSHHIGDMQNLETLKAFERAVDHMQSIFSIAPELIACDLHPGYLSTSWAQEHTDKTANRRLARVQHHHAHIASVMAEHGSDGSQPVIGFSFDGTGYGTDGAIWGGEVLIANYRGFERAAHLKYFPLPGGDAAIRRPNRTALAALWAAGIDWDERLPPVAASTAPERRVIWRMLETGLNSVATSSMGRLFDAVAALAGVRQTANYEAQAAIELEARAARNITSAYSFDLPTIHTPTFDAAPVLHAIVTDVLAGVASEIIAARFHNAMADLVLEVSLWLRRREGLNQVALSGGVFQNMTLLQRVVQRLCKADFTILTHRRVPPNDGGLALGQAVIAAFMDKETGYVPWCAWKSYRNL
jgi:hydrogenase maturation protein HypF